MSDSVKILLEVVDKASPELQKFQTNLQQVGASIKGFAVAAGALGAAAGMAIGAGLAAMAKNAINAADEMGKTAQKIGLSVEELSALNYAAGLSDVSLEQLKTGFNQLNKSIVEANDPTTAAAAAFKYLGVETKNADGSFRKADAVFKDVSESMSKLPDGTSKSAVAMEIFGKAGADLIPMLNSGKAGLEELRIEAEKLGLIISTDTAKAAENFNDSLTRVGNAATGVGMSIAKEVLPTLNALAAQMVEAVTKGEGFKDFAKGVGEVFKWVVKAGGGVVLVFNVIGKGIGALAAAAVAILNKDFAGAKQIISDFGDDAKSAGSSYTDFSASLDAGIAPMEREAKATTAAANAKGDYTGKSKAAKDAKDEETKAFDKAYAAMLKESEGYKELTAAQQVEYNIAKNVVGFRTAEHQSKMRDLAAEVDKIRLNTVALREQATAKNDLLRLNRDLSMTTAQLGVAMGIEQEYGKQAADNYLATRAAANTLLATLDQLKEAYRVALTTGNSKEASELEAQIAVRQKQYSAFVAQGSEEAKRYANTIESQRKINEEVGTWRSLVGDVRDRTTELATQEELVWKWLAAGSISAQEFALAMQKIDGSKMELLKSQVSEFDKKVAGVAGTLQSTFGDVFYSIMQGNFKDIGSMFKQMLDKMVAEALAAQLAKTLFGDFGRTGSVSGSGGAALTSIIGGLFGMRADGGPVSAGQPYIVGERRAELFVPDRSGTILPDTSALAMAGGNNVNFAITAMDSQSVIAAIDKIKRPLAEMMNGTNRAYNLG